MKEQILAHAPVWLQNTGISIFNWRQWRARQTGAYHPWFKLCAQAWTWDKQQWRDFQQEQLDEFLHFAVQNSKQYAQFNAKKGLQGFPILEKAQLIQELDQIATVEEREAWVSHTGGTTGASMKVLYTLSDVQERFATLDWFRSLSGWQLGKRTAWFSGKNIVRDKDIANGNCSRDDWLTKTRFFSTFHINEKNFDLYWNALIEFAPEFIVGFPSSLSEILSIARAKGLEFPHKVTAVFPTAETVLPFHRQLFAEMLGAITRDQYASSEGAPFIIECNSGELHILPHTGIFEVLDDDGNPAREGEIVVTAFHTHGTPLIRYRIGDRIALADPEAACACGSTFPIVERIEGRNADFVWSPEYGRINLGNLSNCTKGVPGIISFRVVQNAPHAIRVEVQGSDAFDDEAATKLEGELRQRVGQKMAIDLVRCAELKRKASGKFRIVENNLSPEQMVSG
jgi:phenylacetate-CoA ligase